MPVKTVETGLKYVETGHDLSLLYINIIIIFNPIPEIQYLHLLDFDIPEPYVVSMVLKADIAFPGRIDEIRPVLEF